MLHLNNTSPTIILLVIVGIIVTELGNYISRSIIFNSKERITECGSIEHIYPEQRLVRKNVIFFDLKGKNNTIKFYYINNLSTRKARTNKKEKDNQKIYKTMQTNDKVCITYSPKYYERSFYIGGEKVPYIFYIEWDRR